MKKSQSVLLCLIMTISLSLGSTHVYGEITKEQTLRAHVAFGMLSPSEKDEYYSDLSTNQLTAAGYYKILQDKPSRKDFFDWVKVFKGTNDDLQRLEYGKLQLNLLEMASSKELDIVKRLVKEYHFEVTALALRNVIDSDSEELVEIFDYLCDNYKADLNEIKYSGHYFDHYARGRKLSKSDKISIVRILRAHKVKEVGDFKDMRSSLYSTLMRASGDSHEEL